MIKKEYRFPELQIREFISMMRRIVAGFTTEKSDMQTNAVSSPGGDGIYLQSVNATASTDRKKYSQNLSAGSGIRVKDPERIAVYLTVIPVSSNKESWCQN